MKIKNLIIIVLYILALGFVMLAFTSCGNNGNNIEGSGQPFDPLSMNVAVLGDSTGSELADFLTDRGLQINNYIIFMDSESPVISGNMIVWIDHRNGNPDIYGFNISTDSEFKVNQDVNLAEQENPKVSGNHIVWVDHRNGNEDIYAFEISTGTEFRVNQDPNNASQYGPAIDENYIVWMDERNGIGNTDIYAYNISTGEEFKVN